MKHSRSYLVAFLLLFCIEVSIAVFINDQFIRPLLGDFLVVVMLYGLVMSIASLIHPKVLASFRHKCIIALAVLAFAIIIEVLQAFPFLEWMGLEEYKIARIVFGNVFDWGDLLAYGFGAGSVMFLEWYWERRRT